MTTRYFLPCECGTNSVVTARQSGEKLRCQCGRELEVPTMRRLAELEPEGDDADEKPLWTLRQGIVFLGIVAVLAGLAFSGYLYWNRPVIDARFAELEIDPLSPAQSWDRWRELRTEPTPGMSQFLEIYMRRVNTIWRWIYIGLAVAVAGTALAVAAMLIRPKRPMAQLSSRA